MEINVDVRHKQLVSLNEFISTSKRKVESILSQLNWTISDEAEDYLLECRINPSHKIPDYRLKAHMKKCALKQENYDLNGDFLSEPKAPSQESVQINNKLKGDILGTSNLKYGPEPKTSDRLVSTYTAEERLALYNYSVGATKPPQQPPEYSIWSDKQSQQPSSPGKEEKKLTMAEMEALERDARRRRMKHKPKSVHINKKSYTEVLKQVIDNQMEQYVDWVEDQQQQIRKKSRREKTEK